MTKNQQLRQLRLQYTAAFFGCLILWALDLYAILQVETLAHSVVYMLWLGAQMVALKYIIHALDKKEHRIKKGFSYSSSAIKKRGNND